MTYWLVPHALCNCRYQQIPDAPYAGIEQGLFYVAEKDVPKLSQYGYQIIDKDDFLYSCSGYGISKQSGKEFKCPEGIRLGLLRGLPFDSEEELVEHCRRKYLPFYSRRKDLPVR